MKTILVTTDFSKTALNAAQYAIALYAPLGATRIILYNSYDLSFVATDIPVSESDSSMAHEKSVRALENLENQLGADKVNIELIANEFPLIVGVKQLIERWQVDLVVAGTTGKSALEKVVMGSNTISLAESCPVPLLIVPKEIRFKPIERIVFACDLKKVSRRTPISEIRFLLEGLRAKLLVLNVALEGKQFNPDIIQEQYSLHRLLDELDPEYHYKDSNDIAAEIVGFAEEHHAGLIISIPKSYGFFEGLFHRSVSKKLVGKAETPLLLLKEKE